MPEDTNSPVSITSTFSVQPETVFNAWIQPDLIRKWLFVGPTSEIVEIDIDLKVDGQFSILEFDKVRQEHIEHFGKYLVIEKPNKLVFTLIVPKHFSGETEVALEFLNWDTGTELRLLQTGVSKEITQQSWENMLQQLRLTIEI